MRQPRDRRRELGGCLLPERGVDEAAHQPHPCALVGDADAQREAFAALDVALDAPQPSVAPEIGRGGDIDFFGSEHARRFFHFGRDCAKAFSRAFRERLPRNARGLHRKRNLGRIGARA